MVGFDSLTMKPGDEVILRYGHREMKLVVIEKITPTGVVRIKDWSNTYDRRGSERGRSSRWFRSWICEATDELRDEIARGRLSEEILSKLKRVNLTKDFTSARLKNILELLSHPDAHLITFDNSAIADVSTH